MIEWPFRGREAELSAIRAAFADPEVCGLVLTGRAGVGKTRLARHALSEATANGAHTLWVRATAAARAISLGAFAHLLPGNIDSADPARLLNQTAGALVRSAEGRRLVLCVDDAHLLDDLSAALVHQLAATATAFVVVIAPHGVDVPGPVFAMWKDRVAERLDIRELSREQTAELAEAALGGRLDGAAEHRLWHLTLGNPLFLRELVQGGIEAGTLTERDGVWRWTGELSATPRLVELISARTERADPDERMLLELLAFGDQLGSEPLVRLGGAAALAATERAGLIVSERQGRRLSVCLAHPLYGEVIRQRTSPLRQRRVHQILAEMLEATGARRKEDPPKLVRWRLAAGLPTDPRLVCSVAESLVWTDFAQAEQLATQAVQLGGGFRARYLLARLLAGRGRHDAADRLFGEVAEDALSDEQRSGVEAARAANVAFGLGDPARALAKTSDPVVRAAILAELGDCGTALELVGPVLDESDCPGVRRLAALTVAASALVKTGRTRACLSAVEEGLVVARHSREATVPGARVRLELARCAALAAAGRLEEAEDRAAESYREALEHRWPSAMAGCAAALGVVALGYGNLPAAVRWLREALTHTDLDRPYPFRTAVLAHLVRAVAMTGRVAEADRLLEQDLARHPFFARWESSCRAWVAAAGGETSRAVDLATGAADLAREEQRWAEELVALHDIVRFGAAQQVLARLESTAARVGGEFAPLYSGQCQAVAAGDGTALDAIADRFAAAGARLLAAEAAAQATRAHRVVGRVGSAAASARRARAWLETCPEARTPALSLLETPLDLTVRELEIARLVATGLTSRAVADRLVVSVRTVDNVLHGVYAKLGISGRGELASVIGMPGAGVPESRSAPVGE
ncbi:helix-turn-helix transcriptional regulator [Amycolatopsis acididurans]|nr:LuxR family transcriptional regulator [Amycolatopsis acididurans]